MTYSKLYLISRRKWGYNWILSKQVKIVLSLGTIFRLSVSDKDLRAEINRFLDVRSGNKNLSSKTKSYKS